MFVCFPKQIVPPSYFPKVSNYTIKAKRSFECDKFSVYYNFFWFSTQGSGGAGYVTIQPKDVVEDGKLVTFKGAFCFDCIVTKRVSQSDQDQVITDQDQLKNKVYLLF